jgi:hypothetical protein
MYYVGLDIHSKRISLCVLNETGQIVQRSQVRTIDQMMRILEALPDRFEICYEASCGSTSLSTCEIGRPVLRPCSEAGPIRRTQSPWAHHPRRCAGGPAAGG